MRKKKEGFTLIEMIAAIAIFGIISVVTISMLSFAFKYNAINRETYEADTNSKIFFESLKKDSNRIPVANPAVPGDPKIPSVPNGTYVFAFDSGADNVAGIDAYVASNFLLGPRTPVVKDPVTDIAGVINDVKTAFPNKNYAVVIKSVWDNANGVFIIDTWSWDLRKGEISMVNRRTLMGPKI